MLLVIDDLLAGLYVWVLTKRRESHFRACADHEIGTAVVAVRGAKEDGREYGCCASISKYRNRL